MSRPVVRFGSTRPIRARAASDGKSASRATRRAQPISDRGQTRSRAGCEPRTRSSGCSAGRTRRLRTPSFGRRGRSALVIHGPAQSRRPVAQDAPIGVGSSSPSDAARARNVAKWSWTIPYRTVELGSPALQAVDDCASGRPQALCVPTHRTCQSGANLPIVSARSRWSSTAVAVVLVPVESAVRHRFSASMPGSPDRDASQPRLPAWPMTALIGL